MWSIREFINHKRKVLTKSQILNFDKQLVILLVLFIFLLYCQQSKHYSFDSTKLGWCAGTEQYYIVFEPGCSWHAATAACMQQYCWYDLSSCLGTHLAMPDVTHAKYWSCGRQCAWQKTLEDGGYCNDPTWKWEQLGKEDVTILTAPHT